MENTIWRIADMMKTYLRNEDIPQSVYILVLYKLLADFKHEADYLREPHRIMEHTTDIEIERFSKLDYHVFEELELQLRRLNLAQRGLNSLRELPESLLKEIIHYLKQIDFTKEIARGNYQQVAEIFMDMQDIVFSKIRSMTEWTTPKNIINILKGIMHTQKNETVLDICMGTGRLAIELGSEASMVVGQEINADCADMAKMNLIIANKDGEVIKIDSLKEQKVNIANIVVSQPPFGLKGFQEHLYYNDYLRWGQPAKTNLDFNFLSLIANYMKDRGAVVVPEGVLFRGGADGEIRKNMIDDNMIEGVISLPSGILNPSTAAPASLLIFKKNKLDKDIFMFDAKEYFKTVRGGVTLAEENLQEIIKIYNEKLETDTSRLVELKEIQESGYVLTVNRYTKKNDDGTIEEVNISELKESMEDLDKAVQRAKDKTNMLLMAITN